MESVWADQLDATKRIIAFDLDDTLVSAKSGVHFRNAHDFKWLFGARERLIALRAEGVCVIIITNQAGLKDARVAEFWARLGNIFADLGFVIPTFVARKYDAMRKPLTGIYKVMGGVRVELYVGDAAGRLDRPVDGIYTCADFSSSDRDFAYNCGIAFATPEQFFLGADPRAVVCGRALQELVHERIDNMFSGIAPAIQPIANVVNAQGLCAREVVVLVGPPGCGKSTFCERVFSGYTRVCQDVLKTHIACVSALSAALNSDVRGSGRSAIIDCTNPTEERRAEWCAIARQIGDVLGIVIPVRCVFFNYDSSIPKYLNAVRAESGGAHVPEIAFSVYYSKLAKTPLLQRGSRYSVVGGVFDEIYIMDKIPELGLPRAYVA